MVVGDIATGAELVIIGAGPGGYTAALRAAKKGVEVVLVDKEEIGGVCLNHGCIPAKALIHASRLGKEAGEWGDNGVHADPDLDLGEIQDWKNGVVEKLNGGVKNLLEQQGVEIVKGEAHFMDPGTLRVEEEHDAEMIEFENAVIATGSRPVELPGFEFSHEKVISSRELLELEEAPEELVIIGGGYIGLEAATKFSGFGSEVKIVEAREEILANFDTEIVGQLRNSGEIYSRNVYTGAKAERLEERDGKAVVVAEQDGEEIEITGDKVLVAVGRNVNSLDELNLEDAGVTRDENGFVDVDERMETSSENIYAIGDAVGQPMLAHKAYREGRVAADVIAGEPAAFDNQYIPKVVYTDPEIAVVGMTPGEARERYDEVLVGRFPFSASGRALTVDDDSGMVRVVASEDEKLLGVQIVGARASDMIAEATLALELQAYLDDVANTIHAHPTFPEAFQEACEDAKGESIHTA